jgi:putative ABC transport system permease protein
LFDDRDREGSAPVAIVNEAFARRYWGTTSVIGRRVQEFGNESWRLVVGVIGDVRHSSLDEPPRPEVDIPFPQLDPDFMTTWSRGLNFVVRGPIQLSSLIPAVRARIGAVDPLIPLNDIQPMRTLASDVVAQPRFRTALLAAFALLALTLATVGVFGVLTFSVTQRTQEIGVRIALGAQPHDVIRMVVARGLGLSILGVALGLLAALPLTRLMRALLFEISPTDLPSFASVAVLLTATAAIASYLPARRATRVDPLSALRQE